MRRRCFSFLKRPLPKWLSLAVALIILSGTGVRASSQWFGPYNGFYETPASPELSLRKWSVDNITAEFRKLDFFVSYNEGKQIIDAASARAAGIPEIIISLAKEIVEYQNYMRQVANDQNIEDVTALNLSLTGYPLLIEFNKMLQSKFSSFYTSMWYVHLSGS